jgi:hypothetical protein
MLTCLSFKAEIDRQANRGNPANRKRHFFNSKRPHFLVVFRDRPLLWSMAQLCFARSRRTCIMLPPLFARCSDDFALPIPASSMRSCALLAGIPTFHNTSLTATRIVDGIGLEWCQTLSVRLSTGVPPMWASQWHPRLSHLNQTNRLRRRFTTGSQSSNISNVLVLLTAGIGDLRSLWLGQKTTLPGRGQW